MTLKGNCLCGAVRLEVQGELEHQPEACHCSQCRKQSGHFLAAVNVRRTSLVVHGEDRVRWFQSSGQVQRGLFGNGSSQQNYQMRRLTLR